MLEAMRACPPIIGKDLSTWQQVKCYFANFASTAFSLSSVYFFHNYCTQRLGYSTPVVVAGSSAAVVGVTLSLYVYSVYLVHLFSPTVAAPAPATNASAFKDKKNK